MDLGGWRDDLRRLDLRLGRPRATGGLNAVSPPRRSLLRLPGAGLSANMQGALWIVLGTLLFSLNDAAVKSLGHSISAYEITLIRFILGLVLLAPAFHRFGWRNLKTERLHAHIARAAVAGIGQYGSYYAVIHLLLASATAISFSRPLFQTLLAVWILHEAVGRRRWIATAIGFVGVLVMVRPGHDTFHLASLVAVGSAFLFGLSLIQIRLMARTEPPPRILFYYHLIAAILFAGPAIAHWQNPTAHQIVFLFLVGLFTTAAMWCFVTAYSIAETSFVGPIEYVRLVYAALIGYFIFREVPDTWTLVGAAVIVGATLYLARAEGRMAAAGA
jgi:drug/metabolite transporter (DMT)-like permease